LWSAVIALPLPSEESGGSYYRKNEEFVNRSAAYGA
jgi:hypothetical protein